MWHGESFYRLGVQGFRILFVLLLFFFFFFFAKCGSSTKVFCVVSWRPVAGRPAAAAWWAYMVVASVPAFQPVADK
jgi:hypothetical protein